MIDEANILAEKRDLDRAEAEAMTERLAKVLSPYDRKKQVTEDDRNLRFECSDVGRTQIK
ncbi:MAG: hypothetical protein Q4D58_07420 [Synergistaceae bacterium]|nr:hypothetical protein [Synergistaceae bacterium]